MRRIREQRPKRPEGSEIRKRKEEKGNRKEEKRKKKRTPGLPP